MRKKVWAMDIAPQKEYPNIVPCLVFPFDKFRMQEGRRDPALVFAQRGDLVLFADEAAREFGVGVLDTSGELAFWDQFESLDLAARAFLSREMCAQ
jgi:hypothetical protein